MLALASIAGCACVVLEWECAAALCGLLVVVGLLAGARR
jgi:hypothetical protein